MAGRDWDRNEAMRWLMNILKDLNLEVVVVQPVWLLIPYVAHSVLIDKVRRKIMEESGSGLDLPPEEHDQSDRVDRKENPANGAYALEARAWPQQMIRPLKIVCPRAQQGWDSNGSSTLTPSGNPEAVACFVPLCSATWLGEVDVFFNRLLYVCGPPPSGVACVLTDPVNQ